MDLTEEIKSRISIEQLVAQYVVLKPAGRNFKGLCPFHQEKTPSFMVSKERQIAWCFGCQKGGDIFNFVQEIEHCDFKEAINILAEKAGIDVASTDFSKPSANFSQTKEKKEILSEIHEEINKFYVDQLWNTEAGKKVLHYVKKRGVQDEHIKKFLLGFAPDSFEDSYNFLLKKNFQKKDIISTGLINSKDTEGLNIYDKFRCRLMFPIKDSQNKIVAFGGRGLKKDQEPKYLNSPETEIYHKSKVLYGFNLAKDEIKTKDEVVLVEGYMDVIASYQAGVKNVVASSGTAISEYQIKFLKRFTNNFVFCFDTDSAGQEATFRAVEIAQNLDCNIFIVQVRDAKDPGDYAISNPSEFVDLIKNKIPYINFYLDKIKKDYDLNSLDDNKKAQKIIISLISGVKDDWEKDVYIGKAVLILNMDKKHLSGKVDNFLVSKKKLQQNPQKKEETEDNSLKRRANMEALEYILGFDDILALNLESFIDVIKENPDLDLEEHLKGIYNKIIEYYNSGAFVHEISKFSFLDREQNQYLKIIQLKLSDSSFTQSEKEQIFKKAISKLQDRANSKKRLNFKQNKDFSSIEELGNYCK